MFWSANRTNSPRSYKLARGYAASECQMFRYDPNFPILERDWAAWPGEPSEDLMVRSQFNLFYDIGVYLFGRKSRQALDYALYFMARRKSLICPPIPSINGQRRFKFDICDEPYKNRY